MSEIITIPRGRYESEAPCWIASSRHDTGEPVKPKIKCKCGTICGIGLHHVHADGVVTKSFYHAEAETFVNNGITYKHPPGCGWHVWLKLKDYDQGEFAPVP